MIERYSRPGMVQIWSDKAKYDLWLEVELAVCDAMAGRGLIPKESLLNIKKNATYDIRLIGEIEVEVKHDVIAFLTSVAEKIGPDSRYIHVGMTSSDLLDTAFAIQLKKAGQIIAEDIKGLLKTLKDLAFKYKHTPMIGRSHGIHAEPITFGFKLAVWFAEFERQAKRLGDAIESVSVGKISGAVGTFAHTDPGIEYDVCIRLGLKPAPISTQVIQRDRHAHYFAVLAGIAASIEKVAVEIRHLQRTEVSEVAEPFGSGQKGSSAMPHKRNPILCENISGLARVVRANATAAFENVALWHERDISHSSVERIIAPDSTVLIDFMLVRLTKILERLEVFPERMQKNLDITRGLYNSEGVMLALVSTGMARDDAYRVVQSHALRAWREEKSFFDLLATDDRITSRIEPAKLKKLFDLNLHLKHVDQIFERVFI